MIRLIPLALLCALSACTPPATIPTAPGAVADKTILDENAALAAELAYKAARVALETGADAGVIRGATAARIAALDVKAYAALRVVRRAYEAGNSTSYAAALTTARAAIAELLSVIGKTGA